MTNDIKLVSVTSSKETLSENETINSSKKLNTTIRKKKKLIFFSTSIILLFGFLAFAKIYTIPLPFDNYRMSVEFIPHAIVVDENGRLRW